MFNGIIYNKGIIKNIRRNPKYVSGSLVIEIASNINKSKPGEHREHLAQELLAAGAILGLFNKSATSYFQSTENIDITEVERLISERELARKAKDFEAADNFRNQLTDLGVEIEDTREGTRWKKIAG